MSWAEVLLLLVTYCSHNGNKDQCRADRLACVEKAVISMPNQNNAAQLINVCLSKPHAFDNAKPAPQAPQKQEPQKPSQPVQPSVPAQPAAEAPKKVN